jgi:hypothetical protein
LGFALEAGPRAFTPDLTQALRLEIAKAGKHGPYMDALLCLAQHQVALIHAAIAAVSADNRRIEATEEFKAANGLGCPWYRKPQLLHDFFEAIYGDGCWQDKDFVEDVLKHHPGLRIKVTRGTRGQQYLNGG